MSSPAFEDGGSIPVEYSCFGDNASPALAWSGVPAGAVSLVLLVTDPDAGPALGASTQVGFAHWIVYDIPPGKTGYTKDRPGGETLPDGARQGRNDFGQFVEPGQVVPGQPPTKVMGYDGPCPPAPHHYAFTLYALDTTLDLPPGTEMAAVLAAMEGHILARAQAVALFTPLQ
ncbi:MAG: YbhB/YbcL family Raf kinase inhibitor-like protein [Anaerolineae bacterium]